MLVLFEQRPTANLTELKQMLEQESLISEANILVLFRSASSDCQLISLAKGFAGKSGHQFTMLGQDKYDPENDLLQLVGISCWAPNDCLVAEGIMVKSSFFRALAQQKKGYPTLNKDWITYDAKRVVTAFPFSSALCVLCPRDLSEAFLLAKKSWQAHASERTAK